MPSTIQFPRGDVEAQLSFYNPPADGSEPYFTLSRDSGNKPKFNFSDKIIDVNIRDVRDCEKPFTLDHDAFEIITGAPPAPKTIDFMDDEAIRRDYYPEVQQLVSDKIPGDNQVFIYDHTVRHEMGDGQHRPLARVHIDHTADNAARRVRQYFPQEAERLLKGRYRIVNVWRSLNTQPLESYPLAFASAAAFDDADIIPVKHRYEDGSLVREVGLIKYSPKQAWYYLSGMRDTERILLKCFDSDSLKEGSEVACKTPHSAFGDPRTRDDAEGRFSIEVRCMVFST